MEIEVIFCWKVAKLATFWSFVEILKFSLLFITATLDLRWRFLDAHLDFLTCKEARSCELSFFLLNFKGILGFSCLFLEYTWPVHKVTTWEIKDGVLRANAILTIVRITIDGIFLLHAQGVDHLAHPLCWLWPNDTLSNLLLLSLHLETIWHVYLSIGLRW